MQKGNLSLLKLNIKIQPILTSMRNKVTDKIIRHQHSYLCLIFFLFHVESSRCVSNLEFLISRSIGNTMSDGNPSDITCWTVKIHVETKHNRGKRSPTFKSNTGAQMTQQRLPGTNQDHCITWIQAFKACEETTSAFPMFASLSVESHSCHQSAEIPGVLSDLHPLISLQH